jgi:hypothetical protein
MPKGGLTASRALISNSSGNVEVSATTSTELGYVSGVTSKIQTQLNAKFASDNIQAGYVNAGDVAGGREVNVTGTFAKAFSATPILTSSIVCFAGWAGYLIHHIKGLSSTGVTFNLKNTSNQTLNVAIYYIAVKK